MTGNGSPAPEIGFAGRREPRAADAPWSVEASGELYRIAAWGAPWFHIDDRGRIAVRGNLGGCSIAGDSRDPGAAASVTLSAVVREARRRGLELPVMVRFPDILRAQVTRLHRAFRAALARTGYGNDHVALYPIKVNPLRHVVAEVLAAGREYGMGLECGSRAELAAALALVRDEHRLLVCNGAKDESMLALAMDAQRLGRPVIPVAQNPEECAAFRSLSCGSGVEAAFGVRIRLSEGISGGWDQAGGTDAKFGLTAADLQALLVQSPALLPRLRLLHFHLGSQVGDLARLRRAAREAAQNYASLVQQGAALQYLDVGGGFGVNYGDGAGSGGGASAAGSGASAAGSGASVSESGVPAGGSGVPAGESGVPAAGSGASVSGSEVPAGGSGAPMPGSMSEYAHAIVAAVGDVCRTRSVPYPILVTEIGRAIAAHHAVLIVPVLSVRQRRELTAATALPPQSCDSTSTLIRWAGLTGGAAHTGGASHAGGAGHTGSVGRIGGAGRTAGAEHTRSEGHTGGARRTGSERHVGGAAHTGGERHAGSERHVGGAAHTGGARRSSGAGHTGGAGHIGSMEHTGGAGHTRSVEHTRNRGRIGTVRQADRALVMLARALDLYRDCGERFARGRVSLEEYAVAERAFVTVARRMLEVLGCAGVRLPARFEALANALADRFLCDFSVFRSLPDHWGAGQAFPVTPIDRLDERPTRRAVLVDLTCDSDGRVSRYVSADSNAAVLPLHAPRPGAPTCLGFFLMGAYEDVLGSAHNLLGRVAEIHVRLDAAAGDGLRVDRVVPATRVADMLAQMGYSQVELRRSVDNLVAARVAAGELAPEAGRRIIHRYEACLRRGTYCGSAAETGPTP